MKHLILAISTLIVFSGVLPAQNMIIDGAVKYQTIHGLGVNINPQSWRDNEKAVRPIIDSLITGLGCTSFRLMFDDSDWEAVNDNSDPRVYNWPYYDSVYASPRFTCIWNLVRYLNSKGITDITLSPVGATAGWMGGTKLKPDVELGYGEMMASMVHYAQKRLQPAINFSMLSPINETGCFGIEAPIMTTAQLGAIFSNVAEHFTNDGITEVTLTGPDDCYNSFNLQALLSSPLTMSKIKYIGGHQYGNSTSRSEELLNAIKNSPYADRKVIMSEANGICDGCDGGSYNSDYGFNNYAGPSYKYILDHLNAGVNGIQLWEGYDSRWRHHHPTRGLGWSMWGIFAVNDTLRPDQYSYRPHYYTFKQLFKFVQPGFQRISISTELPAMTVSSFYNPANGTTVITGKNDSKKSQVLQGLLKNLPRISAMSYYFTDETHEFVRGKDVPVTGKRFLQSVPPKAVFTLISK